MRSALATLFVLASLLLASCGEGFDIADGGTASALIGPAGGTVTLPGGVRLVVPAGALASPTAITIRRITPGEVDPSLAGATFDEALALEPEGLALAVPATLEIRRSLTEGGLSQVLGCVPYVVMSDGKGSGTETPDEIEATTSPDLDEQLVSFGLNDLNRTAISMTSGNITVVFEYTDAIPAGTSDIANVTVSVPAGMEVHGIADALWATNSTDITTEIEGAFHAFPQAAAITGIVGPVQVTETFDITCPPGVDDGVTELGLALLGADVTPPGRPRKTFSSILVRVKSDQIDCIPPPGTGIEEPFTVSGGAFMSLLEGAGLMPTLPGCTPDVAPRIIIAGSDPTGQFPAAGVVNAATGMFESIYVMPASGMNNTAFDAHVLVPPGFESSGLMPGLVTNGTVSAFRSIDSACAPTGPSDFGFGFRPDTSYVGGDPTKGVVSATFTGLELQSLGSGGGIDRTAIPLSGGVRTAVANCDADTFVTIMGPTQMTLVTWNGAVATETPVNHFGTNLRRARWDPQTGLMAISDLTEDRLYVFTWNGTSFPFLIGTADVGAGPVGLDVLGNRIVCAGFNDDTYSLVEVDLTGGQITSVSTQNHPFTSGTQPGHALFMRDANNSICISFFGDDRIGFIPFVF